MKICEEGLCQCGCGQRTALARDTDARRRQVRGQPVRFVDGHNTRGAGSPFWRGGVSAYVAPSNAASKQGTSWRHREIVERAMGKPLPKGAEVHHVNGDKRDNSHGNLVVCQDRSYHRLLEMRQRALAGGGDASYRKCRFCGQWDAPANLSIRAAMVQHRDCFNSAQRERRSRTSIRL